jgi:hypothetical protein
VHVPYIEEFSFRYIFEPKCVSEMCFFVDGIWFKNKSKFLIEIKCEKCSFKLLEATTLKKKDLRRKTLNNLEQRKSKND